MIGLNTATYAFMNQTVSESYWEETATHSMAAAEMKNPITMNVVTNAARVGAPFKLRELIRLHDLHDAFAFA